MAGNNDLNDFGGHDIEERSATAMPMKQRQALRLRLSAGIANGDPGRYRSAGCCERASEQRYARSYLMLVPSALLSV